MRPTFMTIVFNLQAAKSSTAFSCLFGKMRKYIFYRKKCGWQYHFSCCDGCKRIDFQFLCLPKRKICAQSKKKKKNKTDIFRGVGKLQCIYYEWTNRESISVRWKGSLCGRNSTLKIEEVPRNCSFFSLSCMQIYTQHLHIYSLMNLLLGQKA